jgi:hypothetical protein
MRETPIRPERVLRYSLGPADRLAFVMLRHELRGWEKLRLLAVVGVAGLATGLLPEGMGAVAWWAAAIAIMSAGAAAAILWSNLEVRRKAARLGVPDGAIELHDLGDRLSEHSAHGTREVAAAEVAQVIATDRHIFVRTADRPLIVPAAAFADREDMAAFAERWDAASRDAVP